MTREEAIAKSIEMYPVFVLGNIVDVNEQIRAAYIQGFDDAKQTKYKSHKTVWVLKIKQIVKFQALKEYVRKHNPQAGGYCIQHKDGYESYSPAEGFEQGNTLITGDKIEGDNKQNTQ